MLKNAQQQNVMGSSVTHILTPSFVELRDENILRLFIKDAIYFTAVFGYINRKTASVHKSDLALYRSYYISTLTDPDCVQSRNTTRFLDE